jgi:hypothetical protein
MKKIIQTIIVAVLIAVSFFLGFRHGIVVGDRNRPREVLSISLMHRTWQEDMKTLFQEEIIREGISLDSEQGQKYLKEFWSDFEPMVFCHPFIILRKKDNSGYRIFMNANVDNPKFDNIAASVLDFTMSKDNCDVLYYNYLFSTPPRTVGEERVVDYTALIKTDKKNNRMSTVVSVSNAEKNEYFIYRDLDVNGIFESIVHVDSLIFNDIRKMTPYTLTEFAKEFENVKADESLPNDNSKRKNKALEASQDGDYNSIENQQ